jgi:hypothetical protein
VLSERSVPASRDGRGGARTSRVFAPAALAIQSHETQMARQIPISKKLLAVPLLLLFPVCTAYGQRPDPAEVRFQATSLKGINEMSVSIHVEGIRDIPESTYRSDIERRLKAAGIKILPPTENPRTYPCLNLSVDAGFIRAKDGSLLGSVVTWGLNFMQLIPQKIGSQTVHIRATTWTSSGWNWGSSITIASVLRDGYTRVADEFVNDYKKVNLAH